LRSARLASVRMRFFWLLILATDYFPFRSTLLDDISAVAPSDAVADPERAGISVTPEDVG
jgi:hypothetical protein